MKDEKDKIKKKINSFMDFCAGIGAGRLGLESVGLRCVGFSEIDKRAEQTYRAIFGEAEKNYGDLMDIKTAQLPEFDLLIAGFPCQTFSVVGKRKGLIDDRGQIIYGLIKILKDKNTPYFIMENVKGLVNHDKGQTLKVILSELENAGYKVFHKVLNSVDYDIPQMRERVYFVGIKKELHNTQKNFDWPKEGNKVGLSEYLISENSSTIDANVQSYKTFQKYLGNKYNEGKFEMKNLLKENLLVLDTRQSDLRLYRNKVPTLRAGRHGILYVKKGKFQKLSGVESLLLQGFPLELAQKAGENIEDACLLRQAGNAMTATVIGKIANELLNYIGWDNMGKQELIQLGSKTAKNGFKNEDDIVNKFNNWVLDEDAKQWLIIMGYHFDDIDKVEAIKLHGFKTDVQVKIIIYFKNAINKQNLSIKLVSNPQGFNQIDKRWTDKYVEMWEIPSDVVRVLKLFTGEIKPYKTGTKDKRRMFLNEMTDEEQGLLLNFMQSKKILIVSDILKGRGEFSADWMLVALTIKGETKWVLKSINHAMNIFGNAEVKITPLGSMKIGLITMQRKGGDNGRATANMLQFKINPVLLFS